MTRSFNLLDEPWIRVRDTGGVLREVSLLEVFQQSRTIAGIRGELASQDAAVLRLLLAILHRAIDGPESTEDWAAAWEDPDWVIEETLAYLEEHRDRFDLRGSSAPFFQVAELTTAKGVPSTLDAIIADVPNGEKLFTSRLAEGIEQISWAEGARWLLHAHAFDPSGIRSGAIGDPRVSGGRVYPQGTGWAGQLGLVIIQGANLFETLMLNLVAPGVGNDLAPVYGDEDLPPWEREPLGPGVEGSDRREPTGPVDCYTWQARRVRLVGDDDAVTGVFLCQGDRATPQNRGDVEPMSAWRYSEPQTKKFKVTVYMPRKHSPDRAFWRGLTGVVAQDKPSNSGRSIPQWRIPANVSFFQLLMYEGRVPDGALIPLAAVGIEYGSQESTVQELVDDLVFVPSTVIDERKPEIELMVRDCIAAADQVALVLKNLASNLQRAAGNDDVDAVRDDAGARFFLTVDRPFRTWLSGVSAEVDGPKKAWMEELRTLAEDQASQMIASTSSTAFAGRPNGSKHLDAGLAEVWFRAGLKKAVPLAFPQKEAVEEKGDEE